MNIIFLRYKVIFLVACIILLAGLGCVLLFDILKEKKIVESLGTSHIQATSPTIIVPTPSVVPSPTVIFEYGLKKEIDKAMLGAVGTYGIVIKDLKTDESYVQNADREFTAASLYKLWVMAAAFDMIQNGKINENDIMRQSAQVLNNEFDIDPDYAEQTKGTITLTVREALDKMITISDNYAALLLSEKLTLASVEVYLKQHGLTVSKLGEPPVSTPRDIARFFEKLYKGELANRQNTDIMLGILKRQTLNGKVPKYLPQKLVIAHKTGEIETYTHDAGIIFTGKGDYIIVVMSESSNRPKAEERIATLSREVYHYFDSVRE